MRLRRAVRSKPLQAVAAFAVIAGVLLSLFAAPGPDGLCGALLAVLMISIALIDGRYFLIPDELTLAAAALALLRAAFVGFDPGAVAVLIALGRALGSALPFVILLFAYRRWRGRDGLGVGDIKLAALAGLWLGWHMVFVAIEVATLAAIAGYLIFGRGRGGSYRATALLPFGLFLAPAIWIGWLLEAWLAV